MHRAIFSLFANSIGPALLTILGKYPTAMVYVLNIIHVPPTVENIAFYSAISFCTGVGLGSILIPIKLLKIEQQNLRLLELTELSIAEAKNNFITALKKDLNKPHLDFEIRVFKQRHHLGDYLQRRKVFEIKNLKCLTASNHLKGLKFQCAPKPQGMVGLTYSQKEIVWDADVSSTGINYNLTRQQGNLIEGTKFVMCVPIISKDDKVTAVISFDSQDTVDISNADRQKWRTLVIKFAQTVHLRSPYLKS